jgi:hypothetical protein
MTKLISLKSGEGNDALSSNQFCCFSDYINGLILKNMGFYNGSRLDFAINHLKTVNFKN